MLLFLYTNISHVSPHGPDHWTDHFDVIHALYNICRLHFKSDVKNYSVELLFKDSQNQIDGDYRFSLDSETCANTVGIK